MSVDEEMRAPCTAASTPFWAGIPCIRIAPYRPMSPRASCRVGPSCASPSGDCFSSSFFPANRTRLAPFLAAPPSSGWDLLNWVITHKSKSCVKKGLVAPILQAAAQCMSEAIIAAEEDDLFELQKAVVVRDLRFFSSFFGLIWTIRVVYRGF